MAIRQKRQIKNHAKLTSYTITFSPFHHIYHKKELTYRRFSFCREFHADKVYHLYTTIEFYVPEVGGLVVALVVVAIVVVDLVVVGTGVVVVVVVDVVVVVALVLAVGVLVLVDLEAGGMGAVVVGGPGLGAGVEIGTPEHVPI